MTAVFLGQPGMGNLRGEQSFPHAARAALADAQLRSNIGHATATIRTKRLAAVAECDDWEQLRAAGSALKQDVLADQLGRIGELSDEQVERVLRPLIPSPQEWGYNHHMTLQATGGDMGLAAAENTACWSSITCLM